MLFYFPSRVFSYKDIYLSVNVAMITLEKMFKTVTTQQGDIDISSEK